MLDIEAIVAAHATFGAIADRGETHEGDGTGGVLLELGGKGVAFVTQWTDRGEPDRATPWDRFNAKYLADLHNVVVPALLAEVRRLRAQVRVAVDAVEAFEDALAAADPAKVLDVRKDLAAREYELV
jgi:hypothetical protein